MSILSNIGEGAGKTAKAAGGPSGTILHRVVREHLLTFLATMEQAEHPLPKYVVAELTRYIGCGDLTRGFARVACSYGLRSNNLRAHSGF